MYYPIVLDFDAKFENKKLKKRFVLWQDAIIGTMLGKDNNWVVGTKDYCSIKGYFPDKSANKMVSAIQGKSPALPEVRNELEYFLRRANSPNRVIQQAYLVPSVLCGMPRHSGACSSLDEKQVFDEQASPESDRLPRNAKHCATSRYDCISTV